MKSLLLASLVLASTLSHAQVAETNGPGNLTPSNLSMMSRIEQASYRQSFNAGKIQINLEYGGFSLDKECAMANAAITGGWGAVLAASAGGFVPGAFIFVGGALAIACLEREGEIKSKVLSTRASVDIKSERSFAYPYHSDYAGIDGAPELRKTLNVYLKTESKKGCPAFNVMLFSNNYKENDTTFDLHTAGGTAGGMGDQTVATLEIADDKATLTTTEPLIQVASAVTKCLVEIPAGTVINLKK